jgi:hypothetical protein
MKNAVVSPCQKVAGGPFSRRLSAMFPGLFLNHPLLPKEKNPIAVLCSGNRGFHDFSRSFSDFRFSLRQMPFGAKSFPIVRVDSGLQHVHRLFDLFAA